MKSNKNIQILPTSQPSRLFNCFGKLDIGEYITTREGLQVTNQHIYITSVEEIKVGDYYYLPRTNSVHKCIEDPTELNLEIRLGVAKIIITTDQDLIKDGVQAIDNEFLEWFVKNPSCEEVEVSEDYFKPSNIVYGHDTEPYKIIIPKEEIQPQQIWNEEKMEGVTKLIQEQETLEEVAEREASLFYEKGSLDWNKYRQVFIAGAKWQQERSYSDMQEYATFCIEYDRKDLPLLLVQDWYEHYKK